MLYLCKYISWHVCIRKVLHVRADSANASVSKYRMGEVSNIWDIKSFDIGIWQKKEADNQACSFNFVQTSCPHSSTSRPHSSRTELWCVEDGSWMP